MLNIEIAKTIEPEIMARIENGMLILRVPLNPAPVPSSTGKTLIVASSSNNAETSCMVNGQHLLVSLAAYIYPPKPTTPTKPPTNSTTAPAHQT